MHNETKTLFITALYLLMHDTSEYLSQITCALDRSLSDKVGVNLEIVEQSELCNLTCLTRLLLQHILI